MKNGRKITLIALIGASLIGSASLGIGLSLAGFAATDLAAQTVYSTAGEVKKSIFLDCETLWNVLGNEVYYMKGWKQGGAAAWILPTKTISMSVSGTGTNPGTRTIYVFEYDTTIYNKIMFARVNPNGLTSANIDSQIWNQTYDRAYNSTYNYYYIKGWVADTNYSTNDRGSINTSGVVTNYSTDTSS